MSSKTTTKCLYCQSKNTKKEGKRKGKHETVQKYFCNSCNKNFTDKALKHKSYPAKIILNAISQYNLGHSQNKVSKLISSKFKTRIPQRTISQWINEYKTICTFARLRKQVICYNFKLHQAKLKLASEELQQQKFPLLKSYLEKIPTKEFPHHIFHPKPSK